jgi:hypothetical protein
LRIGILGFGKLPIRLVNQHLLIRDICKKCIDNGIPESGKLLVNRHHQIRDICNKRIENGIPRFGKLLVNRHHQIRDICNKHIENPHSGIQQAAYQAGQPASSESGYL